MLGMPIFTILLFHRPFVLSAPGWDNWMIEHAKRSKALVIDGSNFKSAIHINHGYSYNSQENPWKSHNVELGDWQWFPGTTTHTLFEFSNDFYPCLYNRKYLDFQIEPSDSLAIQKNIISFSYDSNIVEHVQGAIANAHLCAQLFPKWTCRFYTNCDASTCNIKLPNAEIRNAMHDPVAKSASHHLWKYLVMRDVRVNRYLIRSVTSRLSLRDFAAVQEWIENKDVLLHVIRDHPTLHDSFVLDGLFGAVTYLSTRLTISDDAFRHNNVSIILQEVESQVRNSQILAHDSYHCNKYQHSKAFPTQRQGAEFVGMQYNKDAMPKEFIPKRAKTPKQCRFISTWKYG